MASAKFLEEALNTDVDESAVSALVGSLENQLGTSGVAVSHQNSSAALNHVNSGISNGGTLPQKHGGATANGEAVSVVTTADGTKIITNNSLAGTIISASAAQVAAGALQQNSTNYINQVQSDVKSNESVKIVYSQAMSGSGTILPNRMNFTTQNVANGAIGLSPLTQQTSNVQTIQSKQPTLVIKTSAAPGTPSGIVTVPMNVTATVPQVNNVGSPTTQTPNILPNLQVVNVRPGVPAQASKGQPARVVLSAPQIVGARQGAPVSCRTLCTSVAGSNTFHSLLHS